jgi:hypothetical protein
MTPIQYDSPNRLLFPGEIGGMSKTDYERSRQINVRAGLDDFRARRSGQRTKKVNVFFSNGLYKNSRCNRGVMYKEIFINCVPSLMAGPYGADKIPRCGSELPTFGTDSQFDTLSA